jgi:hypothetical protein
VFNEYLTQTIQTAHLSSILLHHLTSQVRRMSDLRTRN